jgi:hypothetical protein
MAEKVQEYLMVANVLAIVLVLASGVAYISIHGTNDDTT